MSSSAAPLPVVPIVLHKGQNLEDAVADELVTIDVHRTVHAGGSATLTFEDPLLELVDADKIKVGEALRVDLDLGSAAETIFDGTVTSLGVETKDGHTPMMVVEAKDASYRLATASNFESYLTDAHDVVQRIAGRHGLTADVPSGAAKMKDYVIQAGTDHALLTQLANRLGYEWFTTGTTLYFGPRQDTAAGAILSRANSGLIRFSARYRGDLLPSSVTVYGWDPQAKAAIVGESGVADSPASQELGSTSKLVADVSKAARDAWGKDVLVGDVGVRDADEATQLADGLSRQLVGAGLHAEGVAFPNPAVVPGRYVTIEDMGKALSGDYYVTEVTHVFGGGRDAETRFVCGASQVAPPPWNPAGGIGQSWGGSGPVVGIVVNSNDEENQGRVKVKFPSLNDIESEWARVVAPGAGNDRGLDFRPEVNDEVLVVFERGDPRFPLVLGGLWNGRDRHPGPGFAKDGFTTSRIIRSRTGHQLELCDGESGASAADRHITMMTGEETCQLVMNEDTGITLEVPNGKAITLKAGPSSLTLKDNGDIVVESGQGKVTLTAQMAASMTSKADAVTVKGVTGATVDGGTTVTVKGSAQGTVDGGGMLTVKGGMVKIN